MFVNQEPLAESVGINQFLVQAFVQIGCNRISASGQQFYKAVHILRVDHTHQVGLVEQTGRQRLDFRDSICVIVVFHHRFSSRLKEHFGNLCYQLVMLFRKQVC